VSTIPTSIAGAAALISYVSECRRKSGSSWTSVFSGDYDRTTGEPIFMDVAGRIVETLSKALANLC
jgi:hypothetical protein